MKKLLIFALIFSFLQTKGQILYTNVIPDLVMNYGNTYPNTQNTYSLDLNKDSINDVKFTFSVNYVPAQLVITSINNCQFIEKSTFADTLNYHQNIDSLQIWNSTSVNLYDEYEEYMKTGIWYNAKNKFIGIRLKVGSDYFYGWIRMANYKTILDYAICTVKNKSIFAGEGLPYIVENLKISDVSNFKNSSDIKISFDNAWNEEFISKYRIIAVKSIDAEIFNLDSTNKTLPENYIEFTKTGSSFDFTLPENFRDFNGDTIKEFVPYKFFVLSLANGIDTNVNMLSYPSNEITLTSPVNYVTNLLSQITYLGDTSYNIAVNFDKITDENIINSYRIIFVKLTETTNFNLDSANNSITNSYKIIPNGNNYSIKFLADSLKDKNGNLLLKNTNYNVYVLTIANGLATNINALSLKSNTINLSIKVAEAKSLLAEDVGNEGNGLDLKISFNKASDEVGILEYRAYVVKLKDVLNFNISKALEISENNYMKIIPNGNNISTNLSSKSNDIDGDLITENNPYKIFILSVSDKIFADVEIMSKPSNIISISNPNFLKAGQTIGENIVYTNLEPDIDLTPFRETKTYIIDLNSDGINDFKINSSQSGSPMYSDGSCSIESLNGNSIVYDLNNQYPDSLNINYMINKDLNWTKNSITLGSFFYSGYPLYDSYSLGYWSLIKNKYIGLQLLLNSDTIYGWLGLDVSNYYSIKIRDYAYLSNINGIENVTNKMQISIFPNPTTNEISVNFPKTKELNNFSYKIYNLLGTELQNGNFKNQNTIKVENLPKGIYNLKLFNENVNFCEKFVKK